MVERLWVQRLGGVVLRPKSGLPPALVPRLLIDAVPEHQVKEESTNTQGNPREDCFRECLGRSVRKDDRDAGSDRNVFQDVRPRIKPVSSNPKPSQNIDRAKQGNGNRDGSNHADGRLPRLPPAHLPRRLPRLRDSLRHRTVSPMPSTDRRSEPTNRGCANRSKRVSRDPL
jgi:hypothetical protein